MPHVTIDAITTLLAGPIGGPVTAAEQTALFTRQRPHRALTVQAIPDGRKGVLVELRYSTSADAIGDGQHLERALAGAGYTDFDDTGSVGAPSDEQPVKYYRLTFEVRS